MTQYGYALLGLTAKVAMLTAVLTFAVLRFIAGARNLASSAGGRHRNDAARAALRGPAGMLFVHGGTATSSERYLPDREIRFDVSPRHANRE